MTRKTTVWIVCFLGLLLGAFSPARATDLSLFVSDEDLSFQAQQQIYTYAGNPLYIGGGLFYSEKDNRDSWLFNGRLLVKDLYQKTYNLGLGFETLVGHVKPSVGSDVFSVGFYFCGDVNLEKTPSKLPISIETTFFYSPPILSFADTKRVFTWNLSAYFHINTTAAVGIRYQLFDINLDNPGGQSWDNSTLMLGAKISF